jgi:hypothetical protein
MRVAVLFGVLLAGASLMGAEHASPTDQPPQDEVRSGLAALPARGLAVLADRRYTMHAGIRPLWVFWIRRDNVGIGRFLWRAGTDGSRGYEMIVGSDPSRAPRKVNKWGYFSEESTPAGLAMLGIMKASDEETIEEVQRSLESEGKGASFRYKAIKSDVQADSGRTGVFRMKVDRDLTYRDVDELLALIPADVPIDHRYRLPEGVRGGYLQTVAEIIKANVQWYRTKGATPRAEKKALRYMYDGKPYEMVLRSSKFVPECRFKKQRFTNLVEGEFRITNKTTKETTDFRLDYGTEGELAEVPVHIVFQPRWWLEVELILDDKAVY